MTLSRAERRKLQLKARRGIKRRMKKLGIIKDIDENEIDSYEYHYKKITDIVQYCTAEGVPGVRLGVTVDEYKYKLYWITDFPQEFKDRIQTRMSDSVFWL